MMNVSGELNYLIQSHNFCKHFISKCNYAHADSIQIYIAGYCNVTAAIDAVQFKLFMAI